MLGMILLISSYCAACPGNNPCAAGKNDAGNYAGKNHNTGSTGADGNDPGFDAAWAAERTKPLNPWMGDTLNPGWTLDGWTNNYALIYNLFYIPFFYTYLREIGRYAPDSNDATSNYDAGSNAARTAGCAASIAY